MTSSTAADTLPARWHASCGLAMSFGFPLVGGLAFAGLVLDQPDFYVSMAVLIVLLVPFALGIDLMARSVVRSRRGSLQGWRSEIDLISARLELMNERNLRVSLERLGLLAPGIFVARKVFWFLMGMMVVGAAIFAGLS